MKKELVLGILFFSGVWGICEAVLGGALYAAEVRYASVILTACGLVTLAASNVYFPFKGTATAIAACAMLYKFLNEPFFACHLFGILLTGLCYDLAFNVLRIRNKALGAAAAVYASYSSFALLMTFVFRSRYWTEPGVSKLLSHILVGGTMAALLCALLVPLSYRFANQLKNTFAAPFRLRLRPIPNGLSLTTAGLWILGLAVFCFS